MAVCEKLFGEEAIPEAISTRPAKYLSGGVESVNIYEHLNINGFKNKQLQTSLETRISNSIPAKATAILSQAALQRELIMASNGLFSWDCYPTYYGSGRLYIPRSNALTYMPSQSGDHYEAQWMAFADGLKTVAAASPEKRFLVYVVQGYTEPAYDPAYQLVSTSLKPQECADYFAAAFSDAPNISVLTKSYDTAVDYYEDFFRTDHHWNIRGAFGAYNQICDELQLESINMEGVWDIEGYYFFGRYGSMGS